MLDAAVIEIGAQGQDHAQSGRLHRSDQHRNKAVLELRLAQRKQLLELIDKQQQLSRFGATHEKPIGQCGKIAAGA
jgi:hypothetical protein